MANIDSYLSQIANGVYGEDVRQAIHDAIAAVNNSIPNSTTVSQEVISSRVTSSTGVAATSLDRRLTTDYNALKAYVDTEANAGKQAKIAVDNAAQGYASLDGRLDAIQASLQPLTPRAEAAANEAAASAAAAASSASAANTAKTNAQSYASTAESAKNTAVSARDAAVSAKTDAQTANTNAQSAKTAAQSAQSAAESAKTAAQSARDTAVSAKDTAVTAKNDAVSAKTAAQTAQTAAESAKTAAQTAATNASTYATRADLSADEAGQSADAASSSADSASISADAAGQFAEEAGDAATAATASSRDAEAYAVGTRNGVAVTSSDPTYENNAKYYAELMAATLPEHMVLASETDLDTLRVDGDYFLIQNGDYVNAPSDAYGFLRVVSYLHPTPSTVMSGVSIIQVVQEIPGDGSVPSSADSFKTYMRYYNTNTWSSWIMGGTELDDTLTVSRKAADSKAVGDALGVLRASAIKVQNILASNTNFNSVTSNGIFHFAYDAETSEYTNAPFEDNGYLVVANNTTQAGSATHVVQIAYRIPTGNAKSFEMYLRTQSAGTWSSWSKSISETDKTLTLADYPADSATVGETLSSYNARISRNATDATTALSDISTLKVSMGDHELTIDDLITRMGVMETGLEAYVTDAVPDDTNGTCTFYHNDQELFTIPWGSGGGGGSSSSAVKMTSRITSGWVTKNSPLNVDIPVTFEWSSTEDELETGPGSVTVSCNGFSRTSSIEQGQASCTILGSWLNVDKNTVVILIQDSLGSSRRHTLTVYGQEVTLESTLDPKDPFYNNVTVGYTPYGKMPKTIYFILDDVQIGSVTTSTSGSAMEFIIPQQEAGVHSFEMYMIGVVGGEEIESNHLYYELMWIDEYSSKPLIAVFHKGGEATQYDTAYIRWRVYTPNVQYTDVTISVDGSPVQTLTRVDRSEQVFSYVFESYDDPEDENDTTIISFFAEGMATAKTLTFKVAPSTLDVQAETTGLELYLDSKNRSNSEENWDTWSYGNISAQFTGFNKYFDGWQLDSDNQVVLRVLNDARVYIPYMPFNTSFLASGKTISIEFTSRNVIDYEAPIISCMAGGKGFVITPTLMRMNTGTEIWQRYSDNAHIRADFVFDAQTYTPFADSVDNERLVKLFINGTWSKTVRYKASENTAQTNPVGISIGSSDAGVDIYCIRCYNRALTDRQIERNWVADTRDPVLRLERYNLINIFDSHGDVTPESLRDDIPYFILELEEMPTGKEDKKTGLMTYTNKLNTAKSFEIPAAVVAGQGTSSSAYYIKNISLKFGKNGIYIGGSGTPASAYALTNNSIPFNSFVLKADVASSEATNNVMGVELYNRWCPYQTPEMEEDPRIRWGIEGYPAVLFWRNATTKETQFYSKVNFNLPKRAPEPYGYPSDSEQLANTDVPSRLESWEIQHNNSENVKFQSANFEGETWKADFEARMPNEYFVKTKIQYFTERVSSTNREKATGERLSFREVYTCNSYHLLTLYTQAEGQFSYTETNGVYTVTCTHDTAARRLFKFHAEAPTYMQMEAWCWYYIWAFILLGTDSYAKNLFIGFRGDLVTDEAVILYFKRKAVPEPYDVDTILGINNSGSLVYSPFLLDTDRVDPSISGSEAAADGTAPVWQAQDSVLMTNIRDAFWEQCRTVLANAFAAGFTATNVINIFRNHRKIWGPAIYNVDAMSSYIAPLLKKVHWDPTTQSYISTEAYLPMLQGDKDSQMEWFVRNRFRFVQSMYTVGDANNIFLRCRINAAGTFTLHYVDDIFGGMRFGEGGENLTKRVVNGSPITFSYSSPSTVTNFEIRIFSGDRISKIEGLAAVKPNEVEFSRGTKLTELVLGGDEPNLFLNSFDPPESPELKLINLRNCRNLTDEIDLEASTILEEAYFDGSSIDGVVLAEGCQIQYLTLPGTCSTIVLRYLPKLRSLTIASYENCERFMLAGIDTSIIDPIAIVGELNAGTSINIADVEMNVDDASEIEDFYDLLDTMKGVTRERNSYGKWDYVDMEDDPDNPGERRFLKAQVSGIIHIDSIRGSDYVSFTARYPYITIDANHSLAILTYMNWDGSETITTENIIDGGNGTQTNSSARPSDYQYNYSPDGWALTPGGAKDANALVNVVGDRTVYAAHSSTVRTYTVNFVRASDDGGGTLYTQTNVPYGTTPVYGGATPTTTKGDAEDYPFLEWSPAIAPVNGTNLTYTAVFDSPVEIKRLNDDITTLLADIVNGSYVNKYKKGNIFDFAIEDYGNLEAEIIAINHDTDINGRTIPVTLATMRVITHSYTTSSNVIPWVMSNIDNLVYNKITDDIRESIPKALHIRGYYGQTSSNGVRSYLFVPNHFHVAIENNETTYRIFANSAPNRIRYAIETESPQEYMLTSFSSSNTNTYIDTTGQFHRFSSTSGYKPNMPIFFGLSTYLDTHYRSDVSWDDIKTALLSDTLENLLNIGDVVDFYVTVANDNTIIINLYAILIGLDIDKMSNNETAKATFLTYYAVDHYNGPFISSNGNFNQLENIYYSDDHTKVISIRQDQYIIVSGADLIVPVKKGVHIAASSSFMTTTRSDTTWTPSEYEIFGTNPITTSEVNYPFLCNIIHTDFNKQVTGYQLRNVISRTTSNNVSTVTFKSVSNIDDIVTSKVVGDTTQGHSVTWTNYAPKIFGFAIDKSAIAD